MSEDVFTFDERSHTYRLNGKRMTGVTTVLGVINKPALVPWAAKQAANYFNENHDPKTCSDPRVFQTLCNEANNAHRRKRDDAAQKGTDVHAEIETLINNAIEHNDGYISKDISHENKQVNHWIKWSVKNNVKYVGAEQRVYSKKLFVAGTYDFKCEIDGKLYIGDIKTTSGIYDRTPFAQCAAYQRFEEEMTGKDGVKGRVVVNLKKDGRFNEEKDVHWSWDYHTDLELFQSALSIYRIMNNY